MTRRLIETWLPIAALGEESVRERRSMTALPPTYYLHVWWARRPLVASRAAILASLLPADADHEKFTHLLGIHGDPVASRKRIDIAKRTGERFEGEAYTYSRAFTYMPTEEDIDWFCDERERIAERDARVLDPTAGGGSVPFESARLRLSTLANDLNPVAALIERATIEFPLNFGLDLRMEFERIAKQFLSLRDVQFEDYFPPEPPRRIADATLAPAAERTDVRSRLIGSLDAAVTEAESGFDIDEATAAALEEPMRPEPPYTLDDLRLLLQKPELLPDGVSVQQLGSQEFSYRALDQLDPIRVTTDPDFYQDNPESTEFWTPGNPLFPAPPDDIDLSGHDSASRLGDLLYSAVDK